jgi:spoIIIJ-associated protein
MEEIIEETLRPILELMHIPVKGIHVESGEDNHYRINVDVEDPQLMIGYHGGTLFSLQHLLKILLYKKAEQEFSIALDIDNYRKRQEENVLQMAEQKVDQVRKNSSSVKMPPMSPYFRRLIHLHLAKPEFQDVDTASTGEGNYRAVVINQA